MIEDTGEKLPWKPRMAAFIIFLLLLFKLPGKRTNQKLTWGFLPKIIIFKKTPFMVSFGEREVIWAMDKRITVEI